MGGAGMLPPEMGLNGGDSSQKVPTDHSDQEAFILGSLPRCVCWCQVPQPMVSLLYFHWWGKRVHRDDVNTAPFLLVLKAY